MSQAAADAMVAEGDALFRAERFAEAAMRFERATTVFPSHGVAWRSLGQALLCVGKSHEAANAFDRAIGLLPASATALWGGALAHADSGNKLVAQTYLRRTLELQPTWLAMAQGVAQLAPLLQTSVRAADLLHRAFGAFATSTYHHARDDQRAVEVGRIANVPAFGQWSFVSIGLANDDWNARERPRIELVLGSSVDSGVCGDIVANLVFHLVEARFYPEPGTVVRDVVGALAAGDLSRTLPHIYMQSPRAWGIHLPLDVGPPAITLAQACPISEAEYQTWKRLGPQRFEQTLMAQRIDVMDLRRAGA